MKKFLLIATSAICLVSCTKPVDPNAFTINGTVSAADGEQIYCRYAVADSTVIDTTVVTNGTFVFNGSVTIPTNAVVFMGDMNDYRNRKACDLWVEPGNITMAIDTANWIAPTVTGSQSQAEAEELNAIGQEIREQQIALNQKKHEAQAAGDQDLYMTLDAQVDSLSNILIAAKAEFVKAHPNSYPAASYMRALVGSLSYEENKAIYEGFSDEIKQSGLLDELKSEIDVLDAIQPGHEAPDIKGGSIYEGQDSIALSDFRGKVVLLDFWASWCVPCRASMPHVLACYKKYHDKGFEVLCVADNDSNPEKAVEAVKQDGTGAFSHILRGLVQLNDADGKFAGFDRSHDLSDKYAVHFIPTKYLIDREGKIVGKMETEEQLDEALAELFK